MKAIYSGTDMKKAYEIANATKGSHLSTVKMGRGAKAWLVYHVYAK